ncbi:MAG: TIGR04348 family glycosyltransferase [Cocleimonas sp.]|nr:TIGR04348 family glycosyltransferase [Cocleimonas sp.]
MNIIIITPAKIKSLSGNRATAQRWAYFLQRLGHKITISVNWDESPCDLMIALHAWRSADDIALFKQKYPQHPLIVAMTGTDLYRFIHSHPEPTLASIKAADELVVLHDKAYLALPKNAWDKVNIIYQSAIPLPYAVNRSKRTFDICVVGHLRDEKDALRTAYAVRDLPASSRLQIKHYGKAHNEKWAKMAKEEMKTNPRYHWFGEIKHWQIRQQYAHCHLMVLSSVMEGGANVISEATVAGLPVIASDIVGSIGLLGEDYPGYYPVKETDALRELLIKAENDPSFLQLLEQHCNQRAKLFVPDMEGRLWKELLDKMGLSI